MAITIDQLLHANESETVIAQPGEPIVNISAADARRKVNRYVCGEISMMMLGIEPALIQSGSRLVWRVPIVFTIPEERRTGLIGALDVDAKRSDLIIPVNFVEEIEANGRAFLKSSPYPTEG